MTYTDPGYRGVQEVKYDSTAQVVRLQVDHDGAPVSSFSGSPTYSVFRSGQSLTDTPLATGTATSSPPTLSASLDLSNENTFTYGRYICVFSFTPTSGSAKTVPVIFDIVDFPTDDDIPLNLNDLRALHPMIDAALTHNSEDTTGATKYVRRAWQEVRERIRSIGLDPSKMARESYHSVLLYTAAVIIAEAQSQNSTGLHLTLARGRTEQDDTGWYQRGELAWKRFVAIYKPADGTAVEEIRAVSQPDLLIGTDKKKGFPYMGYASGRGFP